MRQSGFDLIQDGALVYGGFSAGAVVATPTLKGIELVDDPHEIPDGYEPEVIWEGLGLYDAAIAPHYKSDHPESAAIDRVVAYFERNNLPYKPLHDGEAIVVKENMDNF
jgi:dipeptidase E